MTKAKLISEIKTIIKDYGSFTTADVLADSSPCVNSMKGATQLAESFYADKVEAVTYETRHDNEVGTEFIKYEELDKSTLEQILKLAQDWKEQNEE